MKIRLWLSLVCGLVTASAAQVQAAALDFTGSLSVSWAGLPPIAIAGGATANVNGSGGAGHLESLALAGGTFATTGLVIPITDPGVAPIGGVQVTLANGAGAFAEGPPFGGVMPLVGALKFCLFGPCASPIANLSVPLGVVGVGGFASATAAVNVTVFGAPWTTGTVAIGAITAMGGAAPASDTGAASGTVSLVTPIYVRTNQGADPVIPVFAYLNLHFVPEPGTFVLVGSGIASLLWLGRARKRGTG